MKNMFLIEPLSGKIIRNGVKSGYYNNKINKVGLENELIYDHILG